MDIWLGVCLVLLFASLLEYALVIYVADFTADRGQLREESKETVRSCFSEPRSAGPYTRGRAGIFGTF